MNFVHHMLRSAFVCVLFLTSFVGGRAQINTDRMMIIGRNALYFDDYVLAIQYFNLIINSKPYLYEPYFYRGLAKFYLEDYTGAEKDCTEAIEKGPFFPSSYQVRGLSRLNLGNYKLAAEDYTKSAALEANNKAVWHNLAVCYLKMEDWHRADSVLDVMISKWPKVADNYCLKANVRLEQKDTLAMEHFIDLALNADQYHTQALTIKASLLMERDSFNVAEKYLDEVIRLDPKHVGSYINRGLCKYQQYNYRGAMADYNTAIELDPNNFTAHYNRGLLRANVGEDNLAIEDFDFVIKIAPDDMMAVFNRATLLDRTGNLKDAIRDYTTVIETYPKFLLGYQKRAEARRRIGDIKGATADENHVLQEQIAYRYGYSTPTNSRKNTTRKKSEIDLDAYNKPITDGDGLDEPEYKNEYRGRVQNNRSNLVPQPVFALTYYDNPAKMQTSTYGANEQVDALNQTKTLPHRLQINNHAITLSEDVFGEHINHIAYLQNKSELTPVETFSIALEYTLVNEFERAVEMFSSCIDRQMQTALSYFGRGVSHFKNAEASGYTLPEMEGQTGANTTRPVASNPAKAYYYRLAIKDFSEVIELAPDFVEAYYNRASAYIALSEYGAALDDLEKVLRLRPDFADAYYNKGIIKILTGKTQDGVADLSKAGELGLYSAYSIIKKYGKQDVK